MGADRLRGHGGGDGVGCLHGGAVGRTGMHQVVEVLHLEFPVGVAEHTEAAALNHDLAARGAIDQVVEAAGHVAEKIDEIGADRAEIGEDEAAIIGDAGDRFETPGGAALLPVGIAVAERNRAERAVGVEGPVVIAALKETDMALLLQADRVAAMRAAIVQHRDVSGIVAGDDDRVAADAAHDVVAGFGDLAGVADEDPGAAEQPVHFEVEDGGVGIDAAMHPVGLDQAADGGVGQSAHGFLPGGSATVESGRAVLARGAARAPTVSGL